MLSVRHLVFLEVAREKSFSKASANLYISQPAVSKHIRALEEYYNVKLFERKGIHIALTVAGNLLMTRLLQVKTIQEDTAFEISALTDMLQARGLLKLGASTTVALYILPKVMSAFQRKFPQMEISLLNRNSENVLEALLNHDINLGIIEVYGKLTNIVYQPFIRDNVIAVCRPQSKIAAKAPYKLDELKQMPVALRERGSGTLAALKSFMGSNGISMNDLRVKVRLGGTEALKNYLLESDCLGFLPQRSVLKELKNGELTEVCFDGFCVERNFYFIQRKGEASELNKQFIKMAQHIYNV